MNKITLVAHKEMIVKFIILIILSVFLSCNKKQETDKKILNLILKESDFQENDSIYLKNKSNNNRAFEFFKRRSIIGKNFRFANKDGSVSKPDDSSYVSYDTVIFTKDIVKSNKYLYNSKGINAEVENFLKDSFDYNKKTINWDYNKKQQNVFLEEELQEGKQLVISMPVYNLNKTKTVVFKKRFFSKGSFEESIYFFKKNNNNWNLIFKEIDSTYLIID